MRYSVKKMLPAFIVFTSVLVICFWMIHRSQASANTISLAEVTKVESILVKQGDTLSSLAKKYAPEKSHITAEEYMQQMICLNNLKSDTIRAGHYIIIPNYR